MYLYIYIDRYYHLNLWSAKYALYSRSIRTIALPIDIRYHRTDQTNWTICLSRQLNREIQEYRRDSKKRLTFYRIVVDHWWKISKNSLWMRSIFCVGPFDEADVGQDVSVQLTMGTTTALSTQAVINGAVIKPAEHEADGFRWLEGWLSRCFGKTTLAPSPLTPLATPSNSSCHPAAFFHFIKPPHPTPPFAQ